MTISRIAGSFFAAAALALSAIGCDSGPALIPVTGTVTLDDAPLDNAIVEFQPKDGRPSYALTDASGKYALKFADERPGAGAGAYTVRIRRNAANDDGVTVQKPLPVKYDSETELRADVAEGGPPIDFALKSR